MRIGPISISPLAFAALVIGFVLGLLTIAVCAYWLWFLLSDWSHITFTRCVVMLFCFFLGGFQFELRFRQALQWRRILSQRP